MSLPQRLNGADGVALVIALLLIGLVFKRSLSKQESLPLDGPPRKNKIFGYQQELMDAANPGRLHEEWAAEYGPVYKVPTMFGSERMVILDPKAVTQFYSKETTVYVRSKFERSGIEAFVR